VSKNDISWLFVLQMLNLPTLHDRRNELCEAHFIRVKPSDHTLNTLLPNMRKNPYMHTLRSFNELPIPMAITNRYKNPLSPRCLIHCQKT